MIGIIVIITFFLKNRLKQQIQTPKSEFFLQHLAFQVSQTVFSVCSVVFIVYSNETKTTGWFLYSRLTGTF